MVNFEKIISFLIALIISISLTALFVNLHFLDQSYPEFVVGDIAWGGGAKTLDLLAPFLFCTSFFIAFFSVKNSLEKLRKKFGEDSCNDLLLKLCYWLTPAIIYCGSNLISPVNNFFIFQFSAFPLLIWAIILHYSAKKNKIPNHELILSIFFLAICFAFAPIAILLAAERLKDFNKYLVASLAMIVIISLLSTSLKKKGFLPQAINLIQIPLILFFLIFIPQEFIDGNGNIFGYKTSIYLKIFTALLIIFGIIDIFRRSFSKQQNLQNLISPIALCALILALKYGTSNPPAISYDDYHFGENLLAFWSIIKFKLIPYVDYAHTHGFLHNDLSGIIAEIFFDGKAESYLESIRICSMICTLLFFLTFNHYTKNIFFASLMSLMSIDIRFYYVFCVIYLFIIFDKNLVSKKVKWCLTWIVTSFIIVVGAQANGLIFVAATAPFFLWNFSQTTKIDWLKYKFHTAFIATIILGLLTFTPLLSIIYHELIYILENAKLNQVAYGIPWEISKSYNNFLIIEFCRSSWLLAALIIIYLLHDKIKKEMTKANISDSFPLISLILLLILLISYTQGRIDPANISRPGTTSNLLWVALLPLALWNLISQKQKIALMIICTFFASSLNGGSFGFQGFKKLLQLEKNQISEVTKNGNDINLKNIGTTIASDQQWKRLATINNFLNQHATEDETYLDLTGRNAHYFYLNRKPAIEITAPYNIVSTSEQKRIVEKLESSAPKIALIEAENINHGGRSPSLRTTLLYRFVIRNYDPVYYEGLIFATKKDSEMKLSDKLFLPVKDLTDSIWFKGFDRNESRIILSERNSIFLFSVGQEIILPNGEKRKIKNIEQDLAVIALEGKKIDPKNFSSPSTLQFNINSQNIEDVRLSLWSGVYAINNLEKIPYSWGKSISSLKDKMKFISDLQPAKNTDQKVNYSLESFDISGADAGLLVFDFKCKKSSNTNFDVSWQGYNQANKKVSSLVQFSSKGKSGTLIVPLDSHPRWLDLKKIDHLSIKNDNKRCQLKNTKLYQRN